MISYAIYYVQNTSSSVCLLPGCTWGTDSTIYHWCIYLGALAPITREADYTSTVPPTTDSASSVGNYNYNLVTDYTNIGPISCNDQTLTCYNATQQTQSFS